MKNINNNKYIKQNTAQEILLLNKIYQSFEALEDTLGKLKLEEPLFITYMAKKAFADKVFNQIKHFKDTKEIKKYLN